MKSSPREQARLHEVDRQLSSPRFRLRALAWLGAPVCLLMVGYALYLAYEGGMGLTAGVLGGLVGASGGGIGIVAGYRRQQAQIDDLEGERAALQAPASDPG